MALERNCAAPEVSAEQGVRCRMRPRIARGIWVQLHVLGLIFFLMGVQFCVAFESPTAANWYLLAAITECTHLVVPLSRSYRVL